MRHELGDYEWTAIKSMLPNEPRYVRRVIRSAVASPALFESQTPVTLQRSFAASGAGRDSMSHSRLAALYWLRSRDNHGRSMPV
jgi:hypothetical protein